MSLAGFIQGMGSPIDTASRQADMFTKLQGLSDAQVRAEQARIQRMRDEQARRTAQQVPTDIPELASGAPAPMVTPPAAPAQAPAAAPSFAGAGGGRGDMIPPPVGMPQPVYPPANVPLTGPYTDPAGYTPPAGMSGPEQLRQLQAARLNRFGNLPQSAQTANAANAQRTGQQPAPVDGRALNIPMERTPAPAAPTTPASTPDFNRLAEAVKMVESGGDPAAVSPKGALGTMQTMPGTLRDPGFGVRPAQNDSDAERERVGRDYLQAMIAKYPGRLDHALAAYNWGPGNVDDWIAAGADPAKLPKETREYIPKVMARLGMEQPAQPQQTERAAGTQQPQQAPAPSTSPVGTLSPEQVTQVSAAAQQGLRVKQMRIQELARQLQSAPNLQQAQALQDQINELRFGAFQDQLVNASAQALGGNEQAVAQLANAARVQYAQTQQGYVVVRLGNDGQYQAVGEPMERAQFVSELFAEASGAAQRSREAEAAANLETRNQILVEQAKAQGALQKAIAEGMVKADEIMGISYPPLGGPPIMRTRTGTFQLEEGRDVGGGIRTETRWVPVQ